MGHGDSGDWGSVTERWGYWCKGGGGLRVQNVDYWPSMCWNFAEAC